MQKQTVEELLDYDLPDRQEEFAATIAQLRHRIVVQLQRDWRGLQPHMAEDILHDTLLRLFTRDAYQPVADLAPWFRRAVTYTARSRDRRERNRRRILRDLRREQGWVWIPPNPEHADAEGEWVKSIPDFSAGILLRDAIAKALRQVQEPYGVLLWRWAVEGYTLDELAARSHIPKSTLGRQLGKATRQVQAFLLQEGVIEGGAASEAAQFTKLQRTLGCLKQVLTEASGTDPLAPGQPRHGTRRREVA